MNVEKEEANKWLKQFDTEHYRVVVGDYFNGEGEKMEGTPIYDMQNKHTGLPEVQSTSLVRVLMAMNSSTTILNQHISGEGLPGEEIDAVGDVDPVLN